MNIFLGGTFNQLSRIIGLAIAMCKIHGTTKPVVAANHKRNLRGFAKAVDRECKKIALIHSSQQIERIHRVLKDRKCTYGEMLDAWSELAHRIDDEMHSSLFFHIPKENVPYYKSPETIYGKDVIHKFAVYYDMEEAGKCFITDRATGCVFHLMRIMEAGLRYLCTEAASFGILIPDPNSNRNWAGWLAPLEKEFRKDRNLKTQDWNALEPTYAQVASHLRTVSTAWRNPTMHVGTKYTTEEAEDIFNAVRGFMRHLASAKLRA